MSVYFVFTPYSVFYTTCVLQLTGMFPFKRFCVVSLWFSQTEWQLIRSVLGLWAVHLPGRSRIPEQSRAALTLQEFGGDLILIHRLWQSEEKSSWHPWSVAMFTVLWGLYRSSLKPPELITGSCRTAERKNLPALFFCKTRMLTGSGMNHLMCRVPFLFPSSLFVETLTVNSTIRICHLCFVSEANLMRIYLILTRTSAETKNLIHTNALKQCAFINEIP